ncbi:predicted protein [Sclerotinia sclerotiorum 1980 UF-70]|uniref:Uncharacterized protein n=1 Tax=Sclerotinia sclerotiorum (strain ATCC 18683 / 1980 / Ss-1) TaxID=665079 RepID=A7ENF9_SCLS1|nr:predicted protein [Sclerotinia sclerotiorum 1980 UF-70]EDO04375.1 predicted protein [Sclerotinia sclerotiorum 1980 UF-70]
MSVLASTMKVFTGSKNSSEVVTIIPILSLDPRPDD